MQVQKDEIREAVLKAARAEFIARGFAGASMREIAARAGVTTSNIYNYFQNKDMLFTEMFKPLLAQMRLAIKLLMKHEQGDEHKDLDAHRKLIEVPSVFVTENRAMLKLLVTAASGSSLEGFVDEITDRLTDVFKVTIATMRKQHKGAPVEISEFCIHNIASMWTNFVVESLSHDVPTAEMKQTGFQLMAFAYHGLSGLMEI
ncbi:MAG: TetR/AcrR family transcriptional regulator [Candidatus Cloacimonetes bacterium]|nr:TetR/AcrR family transcriptional regulator [Candidatus Cloacimonadota bacterium]